MDTGFVRVWRGSSARVLRGGSWNNDNPDNLRASYRNRNDPTNRNNNIGLRCGRSSQWFGQAQDIFGLQGRRGTARDQITPLLVPAWRPRVKNTRDDGPKIPGGSGLW